MRLSVEQLGQRRGAQQVGSEISNAALGIADAAWPAARVAGASRGEAFARLARARQGEIRTKWLGFFGSKLGKQVRAGRQKQVGNGFQH
jgi:hypothetical protein